MTAMASPPLTPKDPRRRTRSTTSATTTTTTSSSSSATSSFLSTPSPSHLVIQTDQTPFHSSSSSVPFSWEQTPGIPKMPSKTLKSHQAPRLPLPPPLRSDSLSRKKRTSSGGADGGEVDPFAVALAECAKDPPAESDLRIGGRSAAKPKGGIGRRFSFGDMFGFGFGRLDLYGSCKTSSSVSESTVGISRVGAYRIINRRIG